MIAVYDPKPQLVTGADANGRRFVSLLGFSLELSEADLVVLAHVAPGSDGWAPVEWHAVPDQVRAAFSPFLAGMRSRH